MLDAYAEIYRRDLVDSVIPFWLNHSLDLEHGGFFSCLDRDGSVYDTRKYVQLQGGAVWMFSRLYHELEPRSEFQVAAKQGLDFLRRYARDPQGRVYYSLTREGLPFAFQPNPAAAVFYQLGLCEYARAMGDTSCRDEAVELFWTINDWIHDPTLLDRPAFAGLAPLSSLADLLVVGHMALNLVKLVSASRYNAVMRETIEGLVRHYDSQLHVFREYVTDDGSTIDSWPESRLFNPGHSIETAWILLQLLEHFPNWAYQQIAFDALAGSLELGWDNECTGIRYLLDLGGKPTLQPEATMKRWKPHAEAIYALVLAYCTTQDQYWLDWLERVHRYTYAHFVDTQHGEWFGYCHYNGELALSSKGGNDKGFFHVPRALLYSIQTIERFRAFPAKVKV